MCIYIYSCISMCTFYARSHVWVHTYKQIDKMIELARERLASWACVKLIRGNVRTCASLQYVRGLRVGVTITELSGSIWTLLAVTLYGKWLPLGFWLIWL